jgi:hypothetical protein
MAENREPRTATIKTPMPAASAPPRKLRWFWIPVRVLLVSFLLALLSFAVCLLLGITGLVLSAALHGGYPNLTIAYRYVAFPAALIGGAAGFTAAMVMERKHLRRNRLRLKL